MRLILLVTFTFAALLLAPTTADAGPLGRIWQRLQDRRTPPAPKKPSPGWVESGPKVVGDPMPAGVAGAELKLRQRILLDMMRHHAVNRLVRDGVKTPDGKVQKVNREQAENLVARVKDADIIAEAKAYGAPDGGRLEAWAIWLWEHKEEIIKFIVLIASLFADERATIMPTGPPPEMPPNEVAYLLAA